MQVSDEKVIRLSQASAGDLVRVTVGPHALFAIVIGQDRRNTVLATLEPLPDRVEYPFHFSPANDGYAISYGPDWYLEIERGTDFQTGSQSLRWASGALRLQGDSWILAVHPSPTDTRHGEIYYDLTTNEMVGTPLQAESAPIGRWRVWQSKEAYLGQTGSPLIGVSAVELT